MAYDINTLISKNCKVGKLRERGNGLHISCDGVFSFYFFSNKRVKASNSSSSKLLALCCFWGNGNFPHVDLLFSLHMSLCYGFLSLSDFQTAGDESFPFPHKWKCHVSIIILNCEWSYEVRILCDVCVSEWMSNEREIRPSIVKGIRILQL